MEESVSHPRYKHGFLNIHFLLFHDTFVVDLVVFDYIINIVLIGTFVNE